MLDLDVWGGNDLASELEAPADILVRQSANPICDLSGIDEHGLEARGKTLYIVYLERDAAVGEVIPSFLAFLLLDPQFQVLDSFPEDELGRRGRQEIRLGKE